MAQSKGIFKMKNSKLKDIISNCWNYFVYIISNCWNCFVYIGIYFGIYLGWTILLIFQWRHLFSIFLKKEENYFTYLFNNTAIFTLLGIVIITISVLLSKWYKKSEEYKFKKIYVDVLNGIISLISVFFATIATISILLNLYPAEDITGAVAFLTIILLPAKVGIKLVEVFCFKKEEFINNRSKIYKKFKEQHNSRDILKY